MKNYLQFLKEEVDLKGNKGIDDDFMKKAEDQAKQNRGSGCGQNVFDCGLYGSYDVHSFWRWRGSGDVRTEFRRFRRTRLYLEI